MFRKGLSLPLRAARRLRRTLRPETPSQTASPAVSPATPPPSPVRAAPALPLTATATSRPDVFRYQLPTSVSPLAFSAYPDQHSDSELASELAQVREVRAVFGVGDVLTLRTGSGRPLAAIETDVGVILQRHLSQA